MKAYWSETFSIFNRFSFISLLIWFTTSKSLVSNLLSFIRSWRQYESLFNEFKDPLQARLQLKWSRLHLRLQVCLESSYLRELRRANIIDTKHVFLTFYDSRLPLRHSLVVIYSLPIVISEIRFSKNFTITFLRHLKWSRWQQVSQYICYFIALKDWSRENQTSNIIRKSIYVLL